MGGRPKEGKVSEVHCHPESDEKQESSGVCERHASCLVVFRALSREILAKQGSSTAMTD